MDAPSGTRLGIDPQDAHDPGRRRDRPARHRVLADHTFIDDGEKDAFAWSEFVLGVPALHLAGGTDEIQYNVIAQRGLGLPRR